MKCSSVCVIAAAAAVWAGAARSQDDDPAKHAMPPFGMPATAAPAVVQPKPAAPRPGMFAAASAVTAKRLTVEQREERRFLQAVAASSRFEGEAAKMALAKSGNAAVRSFAATLVNHHASASPELQRMLHVRGMADPMLANDQRKTLNRLAKLNGAKFDREFLDEVGLRTQLEDVVLFEKAALVAKDPQLKAWIDKNVSTVKYHLATAERAANREVKVATKPAASAQTFKQAVVPAQNKQAVVQQPMSGPSTLFSQPPMPTQFMGAPPFQMGLPHPVNQPVSARSSESNIR